MDYTLAFEYVEPMINPQTGQVTRDGFWKCTKSVNASDAETIEDCRRWVRAPLNDKGYTRKSHVVVLDEHRAMDLRDGAIPDEAFEMAVLRHNKMEVA